MTEEITIANVPDEQRYVIYVGGEEAGFTQYRQRPGVVALVHTKILPGFQGRGLATKVVAAALDDVRARGLALLPFCPLVNAFIQNHPEYRELVPERDRARFDL